MRKVIAAINMTLDGYCDHDAISPNEEIHAHYAALLKHTGVALYGRITYELMTYWQGIRTNPTGIPEMDHFAAVMDKTPKLVFSRTLSSLHWHSAQLAARSLEEEVAVLRSMEGDPIYACSPSIIVQLAKAKLLDELQICIHPFIVGKGKRLFDGVALQSLRLTHTKTFTSGAVIHTYTPL